MFFGACAAVIAGQALCFRPLQGPMVTFPLLDEEGEGAAVGFS